jgi:hypothetical protein
MGLSDAARYEIDTRLRTKERDYEDAVIAAHGLSFNAIANDGLIIAGQSIGLSFAAVNRGATDVTVTNLAIQGFEGAGACTAGPAAKNGVYACAVNATVPASAPATDPYFVDNYWKHPANAAHYEYTPSVPFGAPFAPTPFRAVFTLHAGSVDVTRDVPVQYRYVENLYFGDKRMELNVVPAFSVRVTPSLAIVPSGGTAAAPATRDVFVAVTNSTKGKADAAVTLTVPAGWRVAPASVPLAFEKEDESLSAKFVVTAPPAAKTGDFVFKAQVTSAATGTQPFRTGYHTIEYPHVERRQVMEAADTAVKVIDVKVAPNLNIGYIMGVGDQVPAAIAQLGAKVTLIERDELAWGDLSKYTLIMTGVRAYERRDDLRAYNRRLLDYVYAGGTVVVNYNKTEFNQAQYGPYPASIGGLGSGRVNDETVPVKILVPSHPIFNFPNKVGDSVWENWTQERGQYFLGRKDPQYVDLVTMTDSFPDNPGEQLGGLVEAKYGKGRWIYLGLGLWRQLPAGTVGAYQLMANILSLPKADK